MRSTFPLLTGPAWSSFTRNTLVARTGQWFLLGLIVLLGVALRWVELGHQSLWADEIHVALAARGSLGDVLEGARRHVSAPPADYLVVHLLETYLGDREFILRFGAAAWSILSIPLMYQLGRRIAGRWAGIVGALLLATSPFHLEFSREVKFYAALVFFTLLSNLLFLRALRSGRRLHWAIYCLSNSVGVYFHPFVVLSVLCQGVYLALDWLVALARKRQKGLSLPALRGRPPPSRRPPAGQAGGRCAGRHSGVLAGMLPYLASAAITGACFAPWFLWDMAQQTPVGSYSTTLNLAFLTRVLVPLGLYEPALVVLVTALAVLGTVVGWPVPPSPEHACTSTAEEVHRSNPPGLPAGTAKEAVLRRAGRLLLVLNVLAIGLVVVLDNLTSYWFAPKQILFALPAFLTLAAAGGVGLWRWAARLPKAVRGIRPVLALLVACVVVGLAAAGAATAIRTWPREKQNWRGAAELVRSSSHGPPRDVVMAWGWDHPSFGFYARDVKPLYQVKSLAAIQEISARADCVWYIRAQNVQAVGSTGETQRAEEWVRKALGFTVDVGNVQVSYGCPAQRDSDQAKRTTLAVLQQAVDLYPTVDSLYQLGERELGQGQPELAARHLEQAAKRKASAPTLTKLGNAYRRLERIEEAKAAYERSMQVDPGYVGAIIQLGSVYEEEGQTDRALALYQQAIQVDPKSDWAYSLLGNLFRKLDQLDAAESAYQAALRLNPKRAAAHAGLGYAYLAQGRLNLGLEHLEQAVQLQQGNVNWLSALADLYQKTGSRDKAVATYRQVLELDAGNQRATEALQSLGP